MKICLLGLPSTGKTTYLTALATHHGAKCVSKERLPALAGIVRKGRLTESASSAATYCLSIKKRGFLYQPQHDLEICESPGEIFENLAIAKSSYHNEPMLQLLERAGGCLVFISDFMSGFDDYNLTIFKTFLGLLVNSNIPLAIVANKVERGEFWLSRHEPEIDLFENFYPKTTSFLRGAIPYKNLKFFALSSFGVLGRRDPRPNKVSKSRDGNFIEVLGDYDRWQPYNLLAPLYWFCSL